MITLHEHTRHKVTKLTEIHDACGVASYQEFVNFITPKLLEGDRKKEVEEQYYLNFADFCAGHGKTLDAVFSV